MLLVKGKSEMEGEVNETGDEEGALMRANNVPEVLEISGGERWDGKKGDRGFGFVSKRAPTEVERWSLL